MKQKLAIVIAALMVASMATTISTSTVVAPATFSVTPASISPTTLPTNRYVIFTLTVSNDTGSDIRRVLIRVAGFDNPLGGENETGTGNVSVSENWDNVAENLKLASSNMSKVTENLKEAAANLVSAGRYLKQAGENLKLAGFDLQTAGDNFATAGSYIYGTNRAGDDWIAAANLLMVEPFDLELIKDYLENASTDLNLAAIALHGAAGANASVVEAGVQLSQAENAMSRLAVELLGGQIRAASENADNADTSMEWAGENLAEFTSVTVTEAGRKIDNLVTPNLTSFKNALLRAADNLKEAATAMSTVDNYLVYAENLRMNSGPVTWLLIPKRVVDNLAGAADNLGSFGLGRDNILAAGASLVKADTELISHSNIAATAYKEFGSSSMSEDDYLQYAGDNLESTSLLDLTTAAANLTTFGTNLNAAATTIGTTAGTIIADEWELSEPAAGDVRLQAIGENYIADGGSQTFKFLWLVPNDTVSTDYTAKIWTYDEDLTQTSYLEQTLTVDGEAPVLTVEVSQVGVTQDNVLGTAMDGGKATILITSTKTLSSLGAVYVENVGNEGALVPTVTMTTANNKSYVGTFTVGAWDDNTVRIRVEGCTDTNGNENTTDVSLYVIVDTRAPIFVENGLSVFTNLTWSTQVGGVGDWFYLDNKATHTVHARAEDNASNRYGYDNDEVVTVSLNDVVLIPSENQDVEKVTTQNEGLNGEISLTAVDWAGNSTEVSLSNIFIDTKAPETTFNTITKQSGAVAWTDGIVTNDNTPAIKLTMMDPGYPTTGLGVLENFKVWLAENDDIDNPATWQIKLENKAVFNPANGIFENTIDNVGKGLKEGTYTIVVQAGDNIRHGIADNENFVITFTVDITAPSIPAPTASENPIAGSTISSPAVRTSTALTLSGSGAESGATVNVYINDATTATTHATVDSTGRWSVTLTLAAGATTKIEMSLTDGAGNESAKQLYGYVLADGTAPSVSVSVPVATGETYSTDQASIVVTGSIGKDTWESYNSGTYAVTATSQVGSTTAGNLTINSDGSFSISVALSEGTNSVSIRATDSAGNVNSAGITVTRTVTPWATYAIIVVIVALILAAIAIFRRR